MAALLETLNITREETIVNHYSAALAELKEKIKAEPLRTSFHIRSGCISVPVTDEIALRFGKEGITSKVIPAGLFSSRYIDVTVSLPSSLVREVKKEEKKVE